MFLMAFIACTKVEAKRIIKEENSNSLIYCLMT